MEQFYPMVSIFRCKKNYLTFLFYPKKSGTSNQQPYLANQQYKQMKNYALPGKLNHKKDVELSLIHMDVHVYMFQ